MKIRKLTIKNYKMFDDLELDFTDSNGNPLSLIVLAGVNGSGKTSILSLLGKLFSESSNVLKLKLPLPHDLEKEPRSIICDEIVMEAEFTVDQVSYLTNFIGEFQSVVSKQQKIDSTVFSQLEGVTQKLVAAQKTRNLSFVYKSTVYKSTENPQNWVIETNDFLPFGILDSTKLSEYFGVLYFLANSLETTTNRSRTIEVGSESISMKNSAQNHDGIVQLLDIFSEKETIEKYLVDSVTRSVIENRKLTGEEAIKTRIGEINNLLQGIHLATKLVDISPTHPIFEGFKGKSLSMGGLSSGEKQFYYRAALLNKLAPTHHLLLIDEPETSLHPTWQKEVIKLYRNAGSDNQIILATHSPHIIASVPPESLFVLYLDEDTKQIKVFNAANIGKFTKGVEPNRILREVMGMKELRDSETQQQIDEIEELLLQHRQHPELLEQSGFQAKLDLLTRDLGPQDPSVMRINNQLFFLRRKKTTV